MPSNVPTGNGRAAASTCFLAGWFRWRCPPGRPAPTSTGSGSFVLEEVESATKKAMTTGRTPKSTIMMTTRYRCTDGRLPVQMACESARGTMTATAGGRNRDREGQIPAQVRRVLFERQQRHGAQGGRRIRPARSGTGSGPAGPIHRTATAISLPSSRPEKPPVRYRAKPAARNAAPIARCVHSAAADPTEPGQRVHPEESPTARARKCSEPCASRDHSPRWRQNSAHADHTTIPSIHLPFRSTRTHTS